MLSKKEDTSKLSKKLDEHSLLIHGINRLTFLLAISVIANLFNGFMLIVNWSLITKAMNVSLIAEKML